MPRRANNNKKEKIYAPGELARLLGVTPTTVKNWRNAGKLPGCYQTLGGHWRYPQSVVQAAQKKAEQEGGKIGKRKLPPPSPPQRRKGNPGNPL